MSLGMEVGLGPGDFVFDGNPARPRKKAHPHTQFLAHIYCGQTTGWIKMPLGMEEKHQPRRRCVRWGRSSPLKRAQPPVFGSCLLWPNGWMDEDVTWYGSRSRPRPHCIRRGHSSPRKWYSSPPPLFGPCLLWPRSPISATAELLSIFEVRTFTPFGRYYNGPRIRSHNADQAPSDVFCHFRIGRAMINVLVKFEISTSAGCEDIKGNAKVDNGVVSGKGSV